MKTGFFVPKRPLTPWQNPLIAFAISFCVLVFPVSCAEQGHRGLDAATTERTRLESRQMLEDYQAAICKDGLLAEFAYLDSSADFQWQPPGATEALGWDSISAAIRRNALSMDSICGHWVTLRIDVIAAETCAYQGVSEIWSRTVAGDSSRVKLQENGFLVRRGDGWKLLSGVTGLIEAPLNGTASDSAY